MNTRKYGVTTYTQGVPFLASARGLVLKTQEFLTEDGTEEDGRKLVKQGTIYPANDGTAIGIVYNTIDVTKHAKEGSLMLAGYAYANRLEDEPSEEAKTALANRGLFLWDEAPDMVRDGEGE